MKGFWREAVLSHKWFWSQTDVIYYDTDQCLVDYLKRKSLADEMDNTEIRDLSFIAGTGSD